MNGNYHMDDSVVEKTHQGLLARLKAKVTGLNMQPQDKRVNVHEALKQWKDTVNYFDNADNPELVDFAIYDMEAAKRRYIFLLRQAKSEQAGEVEIDMN